MELSRKHSLLCNIFRHNSFVNLDCKNGRKMKTEVVVVVQVQVEESIMVMNSRKKTCTNPSSLGSTKKSRITYNSTGNCTLIPSARLNGISTIINQSTPHHQRRQISPPSNKSSSYRNHPFNPSNRRIQSISQSLSHHR